MLEAIGQVLSPARSDRCRGTSRQVQECRLGTRLLMANAFIANAAILTVMFTARVSLTCSQDGRQDLVERLSEEAMVVPSKFDGCQFYVVSVDQNDPYHVLIAEEWSDRACFDAYQQSEYFAETLETLKACLASPPNSAYYDSTLVGP